MIFTSMVTVGREKTKICSAFGCRKIVPADRVIVGNGEERRIQDDF